WFKLARSPAADLLQALPVRLCSQLWYLTSSTFYAVDDTTFKRPRAAVPAGIFPTARGDLVRSIPRRRKAAINARIGRAIGDFKDSSFAGVRPIARRRVCDWTFGVRNVCFDRSASGKFVQGQRLGESAHFAIWGRGGGSMAADELSSANKDFVAI